MLKCELMNTRENFKSNIKRLRESLDLSQRAVAEATEVDPVTYRNYEYGKRWPQPEVLDKIASYFGVKTSDLLETEIEEISLDRAMRVIIKNQGILTTVNPLIELAGKITDPKRQDAARMFLQSLVDGAEQEGRSKEQKKKEA